VDALGRRTHFDYCSCGNLSSITDPLRRVTTWLHDVQGRVTTKVYPDNTQISYNYETNSSRLSSVTDAKNQTTLYQYFIDNNLKQVSYTNAAITTPSVSYTYDTNYNRVLTMTDGIGTTTYSYYTVTNGQLGAGKLQSVDGPWTNDTVTYFYDALGRATNRSINGVAQTVSLDALGRVTTLTNALGSFTNLYVGATARIATNFYPNGQQTVFSYYGNTNDDRLQQIQNLLPNGQNLSSFAYTYDADGQITTWTRQSDTNSPTVFSLGYDTGDQLLSAILATNNMTGAILSQYAYGYDLAGNRLSEQIQAGTNSPASITAGSFNNLNQLTNLAGASGPMLFAGSLNKLANVSVNSNAAFLNPHTTNFTGYANVITGTNTVQVTATDSYGNSRTNNYQIVVTNNGVAETLSYDLNGNETSATTCCSTNTYEWDAADRLTAIDSASNRTEFSYDGLGRRVQIVEKLGGNVVTAKKFLWCNLEICEERDSTGSNVTKRFFAQGQANAGTNLFYTRDHLASVRELTDATGAIRARYSYDPYGRQTKLSGDLDADFAFTGHYYHTGLYLAVHRTYDPSSARWLSRDPLGEPAGINLYAYVRNGPVKWTDPLGLIIKFSANSSPEFRQNVLEALVILMYSPTGADLISKAQNSKGTLTIKPPDPGDEEPDAEAGPWLGSKNNPQDSYIQLNENTGNFLSPRQIQESIMSGQEVPENTTGGAVVIGHEMALVILPNVDEFDELYVDLWYENFIRNDLGLCSRPGQGKRIYPLIP
jgi:RHS repeat-associated protein